MTKQLATLLVTVLISAAASADTLRVATLNCEFLITSKVHVKYGHGFTLDDAEKATWNAGTFRKDKFEAAAAAVAKEIAAIGADVIALTEVGGETDVAFLRDAVAAEGLDYPHSEVCDSSDSTGQHVAVLSRFPLSGTIMELPGREFFDVEADDNEEGNTGVSKGMAVSFDFEGETIHLYCAHLISERGGEDSDRKRVAQASIVRRNYLERLNNGEHIIVAGDLNDPRGSAPLRRIRGRDDLFGDLIQTGTEEYWKDSSKLDERWTYEFKGERNQIDHILPSWSLRDGSNIKASAHVPTVTLPGGYEVTDHRGLIVEIEF